MLTEENIDTRSVSMVASFCTMARQGFGLNEATSAWKQRHTLSLFATKLSRMRSLW